MYASTDVAKNVYVVDQKLGGGKLSLSACLGVGNRPPGKKNIANPRGCTRGGMATGKIAACIIRDLVLFVTQASSRQCQGGKGLHDATP